MIQSFFVDKMPVGTAWGQEPDELVHLQRGMSAREFDADDYPIKSRAFRFGLFELIDQVVEVVNNGDGDALCNLTQDQVLEGVAKAENLNTPFISTAPIELNGRSHAEFHAAKHDDGILVDLLVPARHIIVPWMMENSRKPGSTLYEVHLVGAVPKEYITKVRRLSELQQSLGMDSQ